MKRNFLLIASLILIAIGIGISMGIPPWAQVHAQESANSTFVGGGKYTHISTATNTSIKGTPTQPASGVLHTIVVNTATAVGAVTVVDTTAANCSGGVTIAAMVAAAPGGTYAYDVQFTQGLCITTGGASDLTVSTR